MLSEDLIGNIKIILYNGFTINYKVICSYEAFSNYCRNNTENSSEEDFNKLIFNNFLENLTGSKGNISNVNPNYGFTTHTINSPMCLITYIGIT